MARDLIIDGLVNVRDLGGLATGDGARIRPGLLVRADSLVYLGAEGETHLQQVVAPRLILDLRLPDELEHSSYVLADPDIRIASLPMQPLAAITPEQAAAGQPTTLVDDYLGQLEVNAAALASAVRLVADAENLPVLVHCTSGKDRTGVVIALILAIVGVSDDEIADDYALTARCIPVLIDRVRRIREFSANGLAMAPDWVFAADRETMHGFLTGLRHRFGGAAGWAEWAGVPESDLLRLRAALVE